jgi:hypothetical protein
MKEEKTTLQKMKDYFSSTPELEKLDVVEKESKSEEVKDKFEEVTLADGVTIVNIEPAIEPNASITVTAEDGTLVPMPVGEYELADGKIIVVEVEGVIMDVQTPTGEEEPVEEEEELANDKTAEADQKVRKVIESIVKESVFSLKEELRAEFKKKYDFLIDNDGELLKQFVELKDNTGLALKEVFEQPTKEPIKKKKNVFKKEETNIFVKQTKK